MRPLIRFFSIAAAIALCSCSPVRFGGGDAGDDDDASVQDGSGDDPDGAPDAIEPGVVLVRVFDNAGNALQGAKVAFNGPTGDFIGMVATDASGEASEVLYPGSSVSAGITYVEEGEVIEVHHRIATVYGVQPGDEIEIGPIVPEPSHEMLGSAPAQLPGPYTDADNYRVGLECDNVEPPDPQTPFTFYFYDDRCMRGVTTLELLGVARDTADNQLAYSLFGEVTAGAGEPAYGGNWQTNFATLGLNASNAPRDGVVELQFGAYKGALDYYLGKRYTEYSVESGQGVSQDFKYVSAMADKTRLQLQHRNAAFTSFTLWLGHLTKTTTTLNFDMGAELLPEIVSSAVDTTDLGRPELSWNTEGDFASTTAAVAFVYFTTSLGGDWMWHVIAPPGSETPLQLPEVPPGILTDPVSEEDAWPLPAAAYPQAWAMGFIETTEFSGWADFRQNRGHDLVHYDSEILSKTEPAGGEVRITVAGQFGD